MLFNRAIRWEQLFVHLCICAIFVAHLPKKTPENNENTEDTIRWELFPNDLLKICVFVCEPTKSQPYTEGEEINYFLLCFIDADKTL